jgi:hypothetical protein
MENMLVFLLNDKGMGAEKDVACVHLSIDFFVDPRCIKSLSHFNTMLFYPL